MQKCTIWFGMNWWTAPLNLKRIFLKKLCVCFWRKRFFFFWFVCFLFLSAQCSSEHWQQQPLGNMEIMFLQFSCFFFFPDKFMLLQSWAGGHATNKCTGFLKRKTQQKKNKKQATCQADALPENTREEGHEVRNALFEGSCQYGSNAEEPRFRQLVLSLISHTQTHNTHR